MKIGRKLLLIVVISVVAVSVPSVLLGYYYSKDKILSSEAVVLTKETDSTLAKYNDLMMETESGLKNLSALTRKALAELPSAEKNSAFEHIMQRGVDQTWRSVTSTSELPQAGIFVPADVKSNPQQEYLYLRTKQLFDIYGPTIVKPLTNVWFMTPDGANIIFDKLDKNLVHKIPSSVDYAEQPWVLLGDKETNAERGVRWTPPIMDPVSKKLVVSALLPLDINGQWVGNIGHHFNLSALLSSLFKPSQRYKHEQHFLLDNQNHYILAGPWRKQVEQTSMNFRPNLGKEPELSALLIKPLTSQPKAFDGLVALKGQDYIAVGVELQPLGWRYFRLVLVDDILAHLQRTLLDFMIMMIGSGILIGVLIDTAVRRDFVFRINKLSNILRRYGIGDLKVRSNVLGNDEISNLANDFNEMAGRLEHQLKIETDLLQREKTGMGVALDGICILDAQGNVTEVNAAFCRMLGYAADEMSNLHVLNWNTQWEQKDIPQKIEDLIAQHGIFETVFRAKDESLLNVEVSAAGMSFGNKKFLYLSSRNITDRKLAENQIRQLAFFDTLTNLPNRRLLLERVNHALVLSERNQTYCALFFIDLDRFKLINDTLGHDQGDVLLQEVGQRLVGCVRESDTVARLGGDEFVVFLEGIGYEVDEAAFQAKSMGEEILDALNQVYHLDNHEHHCSCSIGISLVSGREISVDDLLKRADMAMYQAKLAGRNSLLFFDPAMQVAAMSRGLLESDLHKGIETQQFILYYQPQINKTEIYGAEVLVRWLHPERGIVSPLDFIPVAEESGLILPLGWWVLESACVSLVSWEGKDKFAELTLSVNVSAVQFLSNDFVVQVKSILARTGANPHKLKLELTESVLADNSEELIFKMMTLKAIGIQFSLDDFGTGYSSLAYLKRLPLDQLKIDRSFVMDVLTDANDAAIADVIIMLAKKLGLDVIAEGVETQEQLEFLQSHGCNHYQGYLYSKPIPLSEFERLV